MDRRNLPLGDQIRRDDDRMVDVDRILIIETIVTEQDMRTYECRELRREVRICPVEMRIAMDNGSRR